MFRIHEHQVEHFARRMRAGFERRMTAWLEEAYPDAFAGMADADVARWVSAGVDEAMRHDVQTEPEVAALLLLFLVLGVDAAETTPWVAEVLRDRGLAAPGKVKTLAARARARGVPGIEAVILDDDAPPAIQEGDASS
jgi:hypothetical protein